ncbi:CPBP family intramembrane metalloprotease [Actinotalea sp. AC32]|nr:CPBP family intramembrane metalloprotease [Actinotalea sp. AC32]
MATRVPSVGRGRTTTAATRALVRRRPVAVFAVLAYAVSWAWWVPMVVVGAVSRPGVPWPTHLPGLLGPAVAAVVVTGLADGRAGLRALGRRVVRWRVGWRWWLVVVATAALAALALVVPLVTADDVPAPSDLVRYTGVGAVGPLGVVAVALVVNGFGEETGWRGFAADRLLRDHAPTPTALVVAVVWAGWHAPLFLVVESFRGMGPLALGWLIGLVAGSVVLTHLYVAGRGSVLLVAAWHTAFNLTAATEATGPAVGAVTSVLVMVWAVRVLRRWHQTAGVEETKY